VLACVNLPLVMPLNEGLIEHKELLKIFNKWKYPKKSQKWIIYKAKKMEDLCGKKKEEKKSLSWENGRACHFLEGGQILLENLPSKYTPKLHKSINL
jgi:hypothetical protein